MQLSLGIGIGVPSKSVASGVGLWTPRDISTSLWLDADDQGTITESGGSVSQWDDKSGNDNHASQNTGAEQPTTGIRSISGLNAIYFNGVNDHFDITDLAPNAECYIFAIIEADTSSQNCWIGGGSTKIGMWSGNTFGFRWSTSTFQVGVNIGASNPSITLMGRNSSNQIFFRKDGGSDLVAENNTGTPQLDQVGFRFSGQGLEGVMGELVVVKGLMGLDDQQRMEGYLVWKWGLQGDLPPTHPYKNNPPLRE